MKQSLPSIATVCMLLLLPAAGSFAQSNIPQMINYQGYLTDAKGMAIKTDTYTLSFSIYATENGTTPLWGPKVMADVPVVDGHFNVILGPTDGATDTEGKSIALAFTSSEAYLAIKVGDEDWIEPRQKILSTPYAMNGVPAGTVVAYAGSATTPPPGWLVCDGSEVPRATYPALFAALGEGSVWGTGEDPTKFKLPDLRGRAVLGVGEGTGLTKRILGEQTGKEKATLTVQNLPSHSHEPSCTIIRFTGNAGMFNDNYNNAVVAGYNYGRNPSTLAILSTGGDQPFDILQPSAALNWIIKY